MEFELVVVVGDVFGKVDVMLVDIVVYVGEIGMENGNVFVIFQLEGDIFGVGGEVIIFLFKEVCGDKLLVIDKR